jgi:predicted GIY-YIG superfamily endonuclease
VDDDLRAEYDLSRSKGGVRGKYYRRATAGIDVVVEGPGVGDRSWYKYDYKVGNRIQFCGITQDLERREQEHRRRWPGGRIIQVGRATTRQAALAWRQAKQNATAPERA